MAYPQNLERSLGPPTWPWPARSTSLHWRGHGLWRESRMGFTTTASTMARSLMASITTMGGATDSCTAVKEDCTRTWSSHPHQERWRGRRGSSGCGHTWVILSIPKIHVRPFFFFIHTAINLSIFCSLGSTVIIIHGNCEWVGGVIGTIGF